MSLLSWIYAPGEQARGDDLDRQLAELNRRKLEAGTITESQYQEMELNRLAGAVDVEAELNAAFAQGAREGADNVRQTVGGAINATVGNLARVIPWQVWALAALAALAYLWPWLSTLIPKGNR